jgi:hypothetical protein
MSTLDKQRLTRVGYETLACSFGGLSAASTANAPLYTTGGCPEPTLGLVYTSRAALKASDGVVESRAP